MSICGCIVPNPNCSCHSMVVDLRKLTHQDPRNKIILDLLSEIERLRTACTKMNEEISQILGKVLGYPWFKDDQKNFPNATDDDGVAVGDHVAETLAMEAADEIERLRKDVSVLEVYKKEMTEIIIARNDEIERLREALKRIAEYDPTYENWQAQIARSALQQKDNE